MIEFLLNGNNGGSEILSYADLEAYVNADPTHITKLSSGSGRVYSDRYTALKIIAADGEMWGTPYGSRWATASSYRRFAQHALPTAAHYADHVANGNAYILIKHTPVQAYPNYISLNRNGYTSSTWGTTIDGGVTTTDLIYFDYVLGKAMRYNPFLMSTPVVFDGVLQPIP